MVGKRNDNVPPPRLSARARKAVLVVHIGSAGAWIGLDVAMAVVVFTAVLSEDGRTRAVCFEALELFAVWPLFVAGLLCLVSGVALGYGSRYGLVRYWWVATKLAVSVVLVTLVPLALRPGLEGLGELGRELAAGHLVTAPIGDMIYPPIVSPAALLFALVLAVFKPWGLIRRRPERT
ncbi:hypothetical protein DFJ67_5231 [Asanoa ferruginea]|uniref:DUF2269 domain-containing protein n=1 Tax=Asanoa ferruginea TaxID=53367 RepID=A0A3D9ZRE3_9ACTN|nr:hypothetical protein [Asanoa ferruginea]REF99204.1 hypothetical protein DFJ67_5231 [Asanoa ferruginea]GIF45798.1 membrane protein [Asanoa ferruginea]